MDVSQKPRLILLPILFLFDVTMVKVNHLSSNRNLFIQVQREEMGKKGIKFTYLCSSCFSFYRSNESDFHYIKSYCPYQNIRDKVWFSQVFLFLAFLTRVGGGGDTLLKVEGGVLP